MRRSLNVMLLQELARRRRVSHAKTAASEWQRSQRITPCCWAEREQGIEGTYAASPPAYMAQRNGKLLYSLVARGTVVLAEQKCVLSARAAAEGAANAPIQQHGLTACCFLGLQQHDRQCPYNCYSHLGEAGLGRHVSGRCSSCT